MNPVAIPVLNVRENLKQFRKGDARAAELGLAQGPPTSNKLQGPWQNRSVMLWQSSPFPAKRPQKRPNTNVLSMA